MKKTISKAEVVRNVLIALVLIVAGSIVAYDALTHFSFYLNATETYGEVSSRIYNDEEETSYNITIDYQDKDGNTYQIEIRDLLTRLVDHPMYDDIYMFYDSKHPEVAALGTRNIYIMGLIIIVCYGIATYVIVYLLKKKKDVETCNRLIDNDNYIMADFSQIRLMRKRDRLLYIVECKGIIDGVTYSFTSDAISSDPEKYITERCDSKVKVYIDTANPKVYTVDVSEY